MSDSQEYIASKLPGQFRRLAQLLAEYGEIVTLPAGYEVLREGQFVKQVPLLLSGLVKVVTRGEYRDLLLYYIQPGESCMMSFIHALNQNPSTVYAQVEEPTEALLIPATRLQELLDSSPDFNRLFHQLSNQRYADLLNTINAVFFENMETRLLNYLKQKAKLKGSDTLKLTHQEIATDLGTAREVVSRLLKKLEFREAITSTKEKIRVL